MLTRTSCPWLPLNSNSRLEMYDRFYFGAICTEGDLARRFIHGERALVVSLFVGVRVRTDVAVDEVSIRLEHCLDERERRLVLAEFYTQRIPHVNVAVAFGTISERQNILQPFAKRAFCASLCRHRLCSFSGDCVNCSSTNTASHFVAACTGVPFLEECQVVRNQIPPHGSIIFAVILPGCFFRRHPCADAHL